MSFFFKIQFYLYCYYNIFVFTMRRQAISLFFLLIISFQVAPIKSFFNWEQIAFAQDIADDDVEKSESKSKKFESCHSLFLEYRVIADITNSFVLKIAMGQLAQGHSNVTFIPPNFA